MITHNNYIFLILACTIPLSANNQIKPSESLITAFDQLVDNGTAQETFKHKIIDNNKPTIVKFYLTWCPPCQRMKSIFLELARLFESRVNFVEVNFEGFNVLSDYCNVKSVPSFVYFEDGQEKGRIVGVTTLTELKAKVKEYFSLNP